MTENSWLKHCMKFLGARYSLGSESYNITDCSGILRSWYRLEYTANDFYQKIYTKAMPGRNACVFWVGEDGEAYHVAPVVGRGVVVNATKDGVVLTDWDQDDGYQILRWY